MDSAPHPLSFRNPKVQQLRRLIGRRSARTEHGQFVFEGPTLLAEAIAADFPLDAVFVDEASADRLSTVCATVPARVEVHTLAEGVLAKVADTTTPQGLIVVSPRPERDLQSFVATRPTGLVIVLDRISDPGNAGAIVRTAEAVGATAVVFSAGCTDAYGPKAVRAAAGSAFRVPLVPGPDTTEVLDALAEIGFARVGTVANDGRPYGEADLTGDTALVLGSEAHGLDPEVVPKLDQRVTIPMRGLVESLNVAAAAAVLGYERLRQLDAAGRELTVSLPRMIDDIERSEKEGREQIATASTLDDVRQAETDILGKKAPLSLLKKRLGALDPEARRVAGQAMNAARTALEAELASRRRELETAARGLQLEAERLDLTESAATLRRGHLHLITQTRDRLEDVFVGMGFRVAEGPEVENDWYNFEALNIPEAHPARGMWDTLYVDLGDPETILLRTHTSPVQIRVMENEPPPIYIIAPGRVYRQDTADASHLPVFHQIEGLVIDRNITFGDLAGTLEAFTTAYFGASIHSRLRPSYFPFTEPSAEYDINCVFCEGAGCRTCGQTGWLELGGCGMVHPNVFAAVGLDPEEWTGFAFGFGIERLALMRHGVDDIRELIVNDVRFLEQF